MEVKHLYISNVSEDVWPFIQAITDNKQRSFEIAENARIADHELFSFAGHRDTLVVLPVAPDLNFLNYFQDNFAGRNFHVRWPKSHSGQISLDILSDKPLFKEIVKSLQSATKPTISSYSNSADFYTLLDKLSGKLPELTAPTSPRSVDLWTVDFFGSKSGIRQLAQTAYNKPEFQMAQGYIAVDVLNAAKIAANINLKKQSVVIKTNKGHAGAGVLIFAPGDLPDDYYQTEKKLFNLLSKDAYWSRFPIIIEDYITPYSAIGGGFPNAEFKIDHRGRVKLLYYCGMRVADGGVFKGVEIHQDVLPARLATKIMDIGYFIGERLAQFDYRGYYDVDFIIDKHQNLFVTESNVRRTGGTHVYHTAHALFGADFLHQTYALSNNLYSLPKGAKIKTFSRLYQSLEPVLFDHHTQEGLVITSVGPLPQRQFGYIIFGRNKKRALQLEEEAEQLLL